MLDHVKPMVINSDDNRIISYLIIILYLNVKQFLFYEKTKMHIDIILIKMWKKLVITLMLLDAGPCKAHG